LIVKLLDKLLIAGVALFVLFVAAAVIAGPNQSDVLVTTDRGIAITTGLGNPVGPSFFDLAANETAWAKFIWFKSDNTGRAVGTIDSLNIVSRVMIQLRGTLPPRSLYFPSGPDSVYIDLITATEVIVTR
jgi:hypothetical protein